MDGIAASALEDAQRRALESLRNAVAQLERAREIMGGKHPVQTRALSVAITHAETAILWQRESAVLIP